MESKLQAEVVQWLQDRDIFFFSVPNEAAGKGGNMKVMGKLKAMGLRKGAPDLVAVDFMRVVFIEFKDEKDGIQSSAQERVEKELKNRGQEYYIVKNISEIMNIFIDKLSE